MKKLMKRRSKNRTQMHPRFLPQVVIPDSKTLKKFARESFISPAGKAAEIQRQKNNIVKNNIGEFYRALFQAHFGGKISYYDGTNNGVYHPDINLRLRDRNVHAEIKASWTRKGQPWLRTPQVAGYLWNLMRGECAESILGIFNYKIANGERLYTKGRKDNNILVDKLSKATTRLLILPHNLSSFIWSISNEGPGDCRLPYMQWINFLHENWKNPSRGIGNILEHAEKKSSWGLAGINEIDFNLDSLEANQYTSLDQVFCGPYKIKNFTITEYKDPSSSDWVGYVRNNLETFLSVMGIREVYKNRVSLYKNSLPEKPDDEIPF